MVVVSPAEVNRERAARTYDGLRRHLFERRTDGFRQTVRRWGSTPETCWPFANAWAATCSFVALDPSDRKRRDDLDARLVGILAYHRAHAELMKQTEPLAFESRVTPPLGPGGDIYYDDNEWVALAILHQHQLTGDPELLGLAKRIFTFVSSGWWETGDLAHPGGVRWAVPTSMVTRNACSTAPAIEIAALLYEHTGDAGYLTWAERAYQWMVETLRRDDDLYSDRIEPDGTVHRSVWSYNQGTMIGAGVLLHRLSGDATYLDDALTTAAASLAWLQTPGVIDAQGPPLFAIFLRNLLQLPGWTPASDELAIAREYGERWWSGPGHRSDDVFERDHKFVNPTAGMITVYSLLAGAAPHC